MSRYTGKDQTADILQAANQWLQRCLIKGGSLFSNNNLWNSQHLAEIERDVIDSQLELEGNFMHRLKEQLSSVSPEAKQLAAEIRWLLFLYASNISVRMKCEQTAIIWEFANQPPDPKKTLLKDTVLSSVGSAETGFNTFREKQFAYLTKVLKALNEFNYSHSTNKKIKFNKKVLIQRKQSLFLTNINKTDIQSVNL